MPKVSAVERRHVVGSVLFGLGWAVADACPGPVLAQLGQEPVTAWVAEREGRVAGYVSIEWPDHAGWAAGLVDNKTCSVSDAESGMRFG